MTVAPDADSYKVILYGSLALTGKGHLTDVSVKEVFADRDVEVVFDTETKNIPHENTMDLIAYKNGKEYARRRVMSIGGGDIRVEGEKSIEAPEIYSETSFKEIEDYCLSRNIRLSDYVYEREDDNIKDYLAEVWEVMKAEIQAGLTTSGILPGGLNVERVAQLLYGRRHIDESPETRQNRIVCAYAFAAAEQNASCGRIVTAPTCGACAVLPAVLKYMQDTKGFTDDKIIDALAVGGLVGNIVKQNASISGARQRSVLLVQWRQLPYANFLRWVLIRSSTRLKCQWSICSDSPATPYAASFRSLALRETL